MCAQRVLGSAAPVNRDGLGGGRGRRQRVDEAGDGEDQGENGEDEEEPPGWEGRGGGMEMVVRFEALGFVFVVVVSGNGSAVVGELVRPHLGK